MQPNDIYASSPTLAGLNEVERLVKENLTHDWILRVEHADVVNCAFSRWRQWGESLYAVKDAVPVTAAIVSCRAGQPTHSIRLCAEKLNPRVRLVYGVYRPEGDTERPAQPAQEPLSASTPATGWAATVAVSLRAARQRILRIMALVGTLLVSMLLLEDAMA